MRSRPAHGVGRLPHGGVDGKKTAFAVRTASWCQGHDLYLAGRLLRDGIRTPWQEIPGREGVAMNETIMTNLAGLLSDLRGLVQASTVTVQKIGDAAASAAGSVASIQADVHSVEQYIQQHGLHVL